jgi:hypothetical protein
VVMKQGYNFFYFFEMRKFLLAQLVEKSEKSVKSWKGEKVRSEK